MNDDEDQQVSAVWTKPIKGLKERLNDIYVRHSEGEDGSQ